MGLSSGDFVVTVRPQMLPCGHCVGQLFGLCSTGDGAVTAPIKTHSPAPANEHSTLELDQDRGVIPETGKLWGQK